MGKLKRIRPEVRLKWYLRAFRQKSSFVAAQEIWLFCIKHKLDVPEDVLEHFIKGIQRAHEAKVKKWQKSLEKDRQKNIKRIILYRYVQCFVRKGFSVSSACRHFVKAKGAKKEALSKDAVEKTYYRFLLEKHHFGL